MDLSEREAIAGLFLGRPLPFGRCLFRLSQETDGDLMSYQVRFTVATAVVKMAVVVWLATSGHVTADEPIFSGPQVGEKLSPFTVRGVFDDDAGKPLDFVTQASGKPIVLIFVHDVNRQSVSMVRILSQYTVSRQGDGLTTGVVWLNADVTEAENTLKRIRHALAPNAPIGVSGDGLEGPGSYGLNRKVMLTILVGNEGVVTGNFALVQPSLQADLPKILESVVSVVGGSVPKLEDLEGMREMNRTARESSTAPDLRPLLAPVIRRDATPEEVDKAATAVEEQADKDEAIRKEVGRIANTIIDGGKLTDYGTPKAQEYLQKWATAYGKPEAEKTDKEARDKKK